MAGSTKLRSLSILLLFIIQYYAVNSKGFDTNGEKDSGRLRVCFVESRGMYKKATKNCPILLEKKNIECVVGLDRLDCLRRINKGTAHFGVFSPEDLITAKWAGVDVLITTEMRFNDDPFEYELVAVVANDARINSIHDVQGTRFCHSGHGLSSQYSDILANYFESTLVARECESDLSPLESRIKASSKFLGPSCVPGPWVPDPVQDIVLKKKYPSLCEKCYNPYRCDKNDKYWGRAGPLDCLTSGDGDVAWVRLIDVQSHFGFNGLKNISDPALYHFLCIEGNLQPLNAKNPCVWVAQPWPAIAAKREYAQYIQLLLEDLNHNDENSWQNALLSVLETYHVKVKQLDTTIPIDDYLEQAVGFTSAYSFPSCNPPKAIVYCTTSLIEHTKCSWLQEASNVQGIEPNIQCIRENNLDACTENIQHNASDAVFVGETDRIRAQRDYHLKPILYEFGLKKSDRYTIVAVVKTNSEIYNFNDLYGKRACLPSYEGAAFISVIETIRKMRGNNNGKQISPNELMDFFSHDSCIPSCSSWDPKYAGDDGALQCLKDGRGDVAFVDMAIVPEFIGSNVNVSQRVSELSRYKLICPFGRNKHDDELCYMHWSSRGYIMINSKASELRTNEIFNSLREMDRIFGKLHESNVPQFLMYGPFDRQNNIMFHDRTDAIRSLSDLERDRVPRYLEPLLSNYTLSKYTKADQQQFCSHSQTIHRLDFMHLFITSILVFIHYYF